ncbi:hypothetical protein [Micromonospora sp. IBHARD004]|uniref:hypothetical protein n=1 Tax=Micromonospora sp. IBHARD004 TaxID=3457764 RepID=UPI0040591B56
MSYQMWVQCFVGDDVEAMPGDLFGAVFGPYVDRREPEFGSAHVTVPDGGDATFYGVTDAGIDSLMISHFSPGEVLDLLVEFAPPGQRRDHSPRLRDHADRRGPAWRGPGGAAFRRRGGDERRRCRGRPSGRLSRPPRPNGRPPPSGAGPDLPGA